MWQLKDPDPVKLIVGVLAANNECLCEAIELLENKLGPVDLPSDVWPFTDTDYYKKQTGAEILRQFISIAELIDPGRLAAIKHITNEIEQKIAAKTSLPLSRPVNIDPGFIEPSKLVLATTKNFSHRVYIGDRMWAEVTLMYDKGWKFLPFTYPDYKRRRYLDYFSKVRDILSEQLKRQEGIKPNSG